jgi:nucleoid-associated protein YejK
MKTAYILIEPPSRVVSVHVCDTEEDVKKVMLQASKKHCLVYSASTTKNGDRLNVEQPFKLLEESLSNVTYNQFRSNKKTDLSNTLEEESGLVCPYCNKKMSSTSGLTNHINAKHAKT